MLWLLIGAPAAAAPAGEGADGIVVTATRTQPVPGGQPTAIDAEEIERQQPVSLLEALNDVAGVRAVSNGGPAGGSFLSIRGGEPNFTLVMVEGIRLNNPTNSRGGAFDFFAVDPSLIERVEVSRDAVSAVHGSDALSGVVNLMLKRPRPGETSVFARAGASSRGDADVGGGLAAGWKDGGVLLGGSWFDSDGLQRGSKLERRQALGQAVQRVGGFEARLVGLYANSERWVFPEDSGGPLFAANRALEHGRERLEAAGLSLRRSSDAAIRPNLSFSWSRQKDATATPAIFPGALQGTPALTDDSLFSRFEAIADIGFGRGPLSAAIGGAWLEEKGRSRGTIDFGFPLPVAFRLDRSTLSAFAEATLRPGAGISLNGALRYDHVDGGNGRVTARAAAAWQANARAPTFFARFGQGYKLPSFYALAHPLIGNPDLKPERSTNAEAGIEQRFAAGSFVRLTLFQNRFRDLVDFDPLLFRTVNRDRVRAHGAELEGSWTVRRGLRLDGALTRLDLESPTPLRGRPRWQGSLRAAWQAAKALELGVAVRGNSPFFDSSIPTGLVTTRGHVEADLGLRWRLSPRLVFSAALKNVTDRHWQDAVGFPAPGRLVRASLTVELF